MELINSLVDVAKRVQEDSKNSQRMQSV